LTGKVFGCLVMAKLCNSKDLKFGEAIFTGIRRSPLDLAVFVRAADFTRLIVVGVDVDASCTVPFALLQPPFLATFDTKQTKQKQFIRSWPGTWLASELRASHLR